MKAEKNCGRGKEWRRSSRRRHGGGGWTPSPAFLEQPLEREITPFLLQMTARVCGGVPSPLIEPIMGRGGKGPLEAHNGPRGERAHLRPIMGREGKGPT